MSWAGADLELASSFSRNQWRKKNLEDFGGKGTKKLSYAARMPFSRCYRGDRGP